MTNEYSSYAIHPDMKSTYTASFKQKLNTMSSTEAKLVAVDYTMGQVQWTRNFWQNKVNMYPQQQYNMTIKVPYYWQRT